MGSLNCDLCDLGISRIERGRESGLRPTISDQQSVVRSQIRTGDPEGFPYYERGMRLGNLASGGSTEESGIGVPSYRRIGVTNPSHKRYTHSHKRYNRYKGSGLETPPTRDIPIPTKDITL